MVSRIVVVTLLQTSRFEISFSPKTGRWIMPRIVISYMQEFFALDIEFKMLTTYTIISQYSCSNRHSFFIHLSRQKQSSWIQPLT
jgi:hypothetical protein